VKRVVQTFIGLTALTLLIVAILLVIVAATAPGTRWLVERAIALSGAPVSFDGLEGTLLRGVTVDSLRIVVGDSVVDVDALRCIPAWSESMLRDALVLERLEAEQLRITSSASDAGPVPLQFVLPQLPVHVAIATLRVGHLLLPAVPTEYAPAVAARVAFDNDGLTLHDVDVNAPAYRVQGDVTMQPATNLPLTGSLRWQWHTPAAAGRVELTNSLRTLALDATMGEPYAARLRGQVHLLGETEPRAELQLSVPELPAGSVTLHALKVVAVGVLDDFSTTVAATVNIVDAPQLTVEAATRGSSNSFDVTSLTVHSVHGDASGAGRIERSPALDVVLALELQQFDPVVLHPSLAGALDGPLQLTWHGEQLQLSIGGLTGTVNAAPFEASGTLVRAAGVWQTSGLDVSSGPNKAHVALRWDGARIEAHARLSLPALGILLPDLSGDLSGNVDIAGALPRPHVAARLESKTLQYRDWKSRDTMLDMNLAEGFRGTARLRAGELAGYGTAVDDVAIALDGNTASLHATVGWTLHERRGRVELAATEAGDSWKLRVAAGSELALLAESWHLDRELAVALGRDSVMLSAHCWLRSHDTGRVCVDAADWHGQQIQLVGSIDALPVAILNSYVDTLPELAGTLAGRWDLTAQQGHWRGTASLASDGLGIVDRTDAEAVHRIELPSVTLHAVADDEAIVLDAVARHDAADVIQLRAKLAGFDSGAALSGSAALQFADLAGLATLSRRIGSVEGGVTGTLTLAGTLAKPTLSGELAMHGGRLVMADPHIEMTAVDLAINLVDPMSLTFHGAATTGKGRVEISGEMRDPLSTERELDASVVATRVPIHITDADVTIGGQIDVSWRRSLITVKGRVEIPRAEITIAQLPEGAVAVSEDVVVVDREVRRDGATRLKVDLVVVLRDDVKFNAFGLATRLDGQLRLRQSTEGVVQLNGTVALVDGTFTAYDQTLTIESGRLVYSGPADNPYVDARATRTIKEPDRVVVVGAHVQGPAHNIETTLYSDPEMSEAQMLSYLVLGRPLDAADAQQGSDMTGAAVALGLKGAAPVIDEIRNVTGIDTLTATGGTEEDLALIAGKHINDKLFVRYSYQTFTRTGAVLIELLLNRRWSLQATASQAPAIDVIYRVGEFN
jgi:translocation and assembly module TamB